MSKPFSSAALSLILLILSGCAGVLPPADKIPHEPYAEREFRAAWVATVANINWPSEPGLSTAQQQAEARAILDRLQELNFNAVIFQVRPQCDALYASDLEPWSYYLTGVQGQAPDPWYDPLEFWINEAHRRGIELHAWLNPYRAHHVVGGPVSDQSIVKTRPELVVKLASGYYWLDPSREETRAHSTAVVMDIIERYDVDGIHFDDYFYPYPSYNNGLDFPDDESWTAYQAGGGKLSRGDWRRDGVNRFIEELYDKIKAARLHVKFGLSPFGIWRPGHPPEISGFDQYDQLYADARLWLRKGWIDYWTPQLYWDINRRRQSYPFLLKWWSDQNIHRRHLWAGISIGGDHEAAADETVNKIMLTRAFLPGTSGNVHWSFSPLETNQALASALQNGPYRRPALVPSSPWLDKKPPAVPSVKMLADKDSLKLIFDHPRPADVFRWVVYTRYGNRWNYRIVNQPLAADKLPLYQLRRFTADDLPNNDDFSASDFITPLNEIRITAVDRTGNESGAWAHSTPLEYQPTAAELHRRYRQDHPNIARQQLLAAIDSLYAGHRLYRQPLKRLKYPQVDSLLTLLSENYPESFSYAQVGYSVERRPVNLMRIGTGDTRVLLWSQMHGDEPTATAALFDVFNYLCANSDHEPARTILNELTILAVPMLNPDGAERFTRRNTQGIDINRDARDRQTPEGRLLFKLKHEYDPDFGFNLHDMSSRETVGETNQLLALALMAPPRNSNDDSNLTLRRAKQVTMSLVSALEPRLGGHIARYAADYMPRAFGDSMQNWGVSTILIESAGWFGASDAFLQQTNFLALMAAFDVIARGDYLQIDPAVYDDLPENERELYDLIVRDVAVFDGASTESFQADLAVNITGGKGRIVDLGDLDVFAAKDTIDGAELILIPGLIGVVDTEGLTPDQLVERANKLLAAGYTTLLFALPESGRLTRNELKSALEMTRFGGRWATVLKSGARKISLPLLKTMRQHRGVLALSGFNIDEFSAYSDLPIVLRSSKVVENPLLPAFDRELIKRLTRQRSLDWGFTDRGRIHRGKAADFVLLADVDGQAEIRAVYIGGKAVLPADHRQPLGD